MHTACLDVVLRWSGDEYCVVDTGSSLLMTSTKSIFCHIKVYPNYLIDEFEVKWAFWLSST